MVEFCKCGGIMIPQKVGGKTVLVCKKCGKKSEFKGKKDDFKIKIPTEKSKEIIVVEKKKQIDVMPKTEVQCPKCNNNEAYWWMEQTRAADEPPTRFFKCSKCGHVWREYE